jgi:hypothetical protein
VSITINPYLEKKLRARAEAEGLQSGESVVADETYWHRSDGGSLSDTRISAFGERFAKPPHSLPPP